ncbi:L-lactate dehydrogenase [Microbacterium resistens]|nr:L-lactate dehydrogenase [Microbacterium resistens]MBW1638973.1 L-lactate dehydrogenase [Microbacterium resistens]
MKSMANGRTKLTVVGAGSVGVSVAYAALIRGSAAEVALYDIATEKVDAEVLDLAHGTQFTRSSVGGGSDLAVVDGSDVVVVTAGAKQQPGQTRMELAGTNARILSSLLPALVERAPEAVFVIVTNPADVMTVVGQRVTGLPPQRIFGSGTVLDTSRLRWRLAQRAGVSTASVHADIVGEHGDTEFPLWSTATIGPVPILDWPGEEPFTSQELDRIAVEVRDAAYAVIRGKGATNLAIGVSCARIAEAVLHDERAVLPVSTVLDGVHGISGVALSVPSVVGADGAVPLARTPMTTAEEERLHASADAIRAAVDALALG